MSTQESIHGYSATPIPDETLSNLSVIDLASSAEIIREVDSRIDKYAGQVLVGEVQNSVTNGVNELVYLETSLPGPFAHGRNAWKLDTDDRRDYVQTHAEKSLHGERIKPSKLTEVGVLLGEGYDITTQPVEDPQALPEMTQLRVSKEIAQLESRTRKGILESPSGENPNILYNPPLLKKALPAINEGVGAWGNMRMTAAALHSLYGAGELNTLGEGMDPDAFSQPIINVPGENGALVQKTALELLYAGAPEAVANVTLDNYLEFIDNPIDEPSRELLQGCIDGKSIRTRAVVAMNMVQNHLDAAGMSDRQDLVSVSLACGAAAPVYMMADAVEKNGGHFEKIVLADIDSMALASAYSLADNDRRKTVELHKRNLLRNDLTEYVPEKSADVVDILGLFEYLPEKTAIRFLKNVSEIVRPGGVIVLGNMVDDRPEQTFFKDVVQWPAVQQRSITETLEIIERAGFSQESISVTIPSNEGVYAVVAIHVPGVVENNSAVA